MRFPVSQSRQQPLVGKEKKNFSIIVCQKKSNQRTIIIAKKKNEDEGKFDISRSAHDPDFYFFFVAKRELPGIYFEDDRKGNERKKREGGKEDLSF